MASVSKLTMHLGFQDGHSYSSPSTPMNNLSLTEISNQQGSEELPDWFFLVQPTPQGETGYVHTHIQPQPISNHWEPLNHITPPSTWPNDPSFHSHILRAHSDVVMEEGSSVSIQVILYLW
jgi:hypothetical protein